MSLPFFGKKESKNGNEADQNSKIDHCCTINKSESGVLVLQNIRIGQASVTKDEAIEMAGQLLVDGGYVMPEYIDAMKEREKVLSTYIGEGVAIPHGVGAARDKIIRSGISVLQFPEGVVFGEGMTAYLVVGIAGKGNEHMKILTNLAEFIQDGEALKELFTTKDKARVCSALTSNL